LDNATISDYEFDIKLKQLQDLENKHPEYFMKVPYATCWSITKNFKTVPHEYRMYSLDNSYSKEDLIDWENAYRKYWGDVPPEYTCELKPTGHPSVP
jgi:DNA ligase (NAD+)